MDRRNKKATVTLAEYDRQVVVESLARLHRELVESVARQAQSKVWDDPRHQR